MAFTDLTDEQVKALQQKSFDMLLFFKDFCDKHSLTFYFCGGCCIGAARNGKFVPWDDDVDVFMPRKDYERLIKIFNDLSNSDRYFLQVSKKGALTENLFATICDSQTTFIKSYQSDLDINHGIVLDILPMDGCPEGNFARKMQLFHALIYSLFIIGKVPLNNGTAVKTVASVLLGVIRSKSLRWKIAMSAQRKMTKYSLDKSKYATELCSGPHYMKIRYNADAFKEPTYLDFEGYKMPVPTDYDHYLSLAFGNYKELPPVEQRKCHHELEYLDTENSYKIYKGKYYCKQKEQSK